MAQDKQKRDLLTALNHIERFHRRRMTFVYHLVLSLGVQFALWANWFSSYAALGRGFESNFFSARLIISVVLTLFLIGHFVTMRLMESKDRLVVKAIQQHDAEDEFVSRPYERLIDTEDDVEEIDFEDIAQVQQPNHKVRH